MQTAQLHLQTRQKLPPVDLWFPSRILLYYEFLAIFFWAPLPAGDVMLYSKYVTYFFEGNLPYRDFFPEYPPLAFIYYLIPGLLAKALPVLSFSWLYLLLFGLLSCIAVFLFGLILFQLVQDALGCESAQLYWRRYSVHIICLVPLVAWRFDIVVALFCLLSLYCLLVDGNMVLSGLLLGLGVGIKLYPLLLLPVFVLYLYCSRSKLHRYAIGFAIGIATSFLPPLLYGGWSGLARIYSYHSERGLQIESLSASLMLLIRRAYQMPLQITSSYGSWNLKNSPSVEIAIRLTPVFAIACIGLALYVIYSCFFAAYSRFARIDSSHLFVALFLVLIAALLGAKVLSPQFMIWLLPFVGCISKRVFRLSVITFLLTTALITFLDVDIFAEGWIGIIVLVIRNILLVCMFIEGLRLLSKACRGYSQSLD